MQMIGEKKSIMDRSVSLSDRQIKERNSNTLRNSHAKDESVLKGQINGLNEMSALEWIKKHVSKHELFSENILTNKAKQGIIEV